MNSLGIVLPNWVGDTTLATPLLRLLRQELPRTRIVGIGQTRLQQLLTGSPWLDAWISYDRREMRGPSSYLRQAALWQDAQLDALLLLSNGWTAAIIARLAGIPRRIGSARRGRGILLTDTLPTTTRRPARLVDGVGEPTTVERYLRFAEPLTRQTPDLSHVSRRLQLFVTGEEAERAERVWRSFPTGSTAIVALQPGSGSHPRRRWPPQRFAQLARQLALQQQAGVLILGSREESSLVQAIVDQAAHPLVRRLPAALADIGTLKACLQKSRLLVTNDTGPRHLAAAIGTPALVLFGPTCPETNDNGGPLEKRILPESALVKKGNRRPEFRGDIEQIPLSRVWAETTRMLQMHSVGLSHSPHPAQQAPAAC